MKKIAIAITGLIGDNKKPIYIIKEIISDIKKLGYEVDVYCHTWSDENRFPYGYENTDIIDLTISSILPKEKLENKFLLQDVLEPKNIIVGKFSELQSLYDEFLSYTQENLMTRDDNRLAYYEALSGSEYTNIEKTFSTVSIPDKIKVLRMFDKWGAFVNKISQVYALTQICHSIQNSEVEYDGVLKWRYDLVTNKDTVLDTFKPTIDSISDDDFFVSDAWLMHDDTILKYIISDTFINDKGHYKLVFLQDLYFYIGKNIIKYINDDFMLRYTRNMTDILNFYIYTGQRQYWNSHGLLWMTLTDMDIHIKIDEKEVNKNLDVLLVRSSRKLEDPVDVYRSKSFSSLYEQLHKD